MNERIITSIKELAQSSDSTADVLDRVLSFCQYQERFKDVHSLYQARMQELSISINYIDDARVILDNL